MGPKILSAGKVGNVGSLFHIFLSFSLPSSDFPNSPCGKGRRKGPGRPFCTGYRDFFSLIPHSFLCAGQFRDSYRNLLLSIYNTTGDLAMMSWSILKAKMGPWVHMSAWSQICSVSCRCSQDPFPCLEPPLHT